MKAGRELDALIAEKVMGWKRQPLYVFDELTGSCVDWPYVPDDEYICVEWCPSTDIAAAWLVVEKLDLLRGRRLIKETDFTDTKTQWSVVQESRNGWDAIITSTLSKADSAPLAICLAALKAVGHKL